MSKTPVESSGDVNVSLASHLSNLPTIATEASTSNLIVLSSVVISKTGGSAGLADMSRADVNRKRRVNLRSQRWRRKRRGPFFWKTASWWRSARISAYRAARIRKVEAVKAKKATKREFIVVATMISRMVGTPVFSDRTEFSVFTGAAFGLRSGWPNESSCLNAGGGDVAVFSSTRPASESVRPAWREPCRRSDAGFSRLPDWRRWCMEFYFNSRWNESRFELDS
jgi:hypothetical protein